MRRGWMTCAVLFSINPFSGVANPAGRQSVPVSLHLPDPAGLPTPTDGKGLLNAYRLTATPAGCSAPAVNVTRPLARRGTIHLDPSCHWTLTSGLGTTSSDQLHEVDYETPPFILRQGDLDGKTHIAVAPQWRRQEAGRTRGFKAERIPHE